MAEKPKLDERFIMRIEGKEFVKYPGLLDLAHQKGIAQIEVEPLQFPTDANGMFAICKAVVIAKNGDSFSDIGDANPNNVNSRIARHLLRMASTRAIARALRSFTNIGMTCLEELADFDDVKEEKPPKQTTAKKQTKPRAVKKEDKPVEKPAEKPADKPNDKAEDRPRMSEAQKKAIHNLAQRRGIAPEELDKMVEEAYGSELSHLTSTDASQFIRSLQQAA
ncbi:hypothetical protein [Desulfatibacillum aliphaticivorans]|uniref:hypothetical protein n=1 Tax=Desulfatibacillum aliphaticivorans TaxID=218208 RepID=UPI000406144B|nr:hypothetical protein [Desulfatibacillum aliphaticivorans]